MHPTQIEYAAALSIKQHLEHRFAQIAPAEPGDDADEAAIDAWAAAYTDARTAFGLDAAEEDLRRAREAMITWATRHRAIAAAAKLASLDVAELVEQAKRRASALDRLTDICYRFSGR